MVRAIEVSFAVVVNEVTFESPSPPPQGWGLVFKGTNQVIMWLKLCVTPHPLGSGEGAWRLNPLHMVSALTYHA